MSLRVLLSGARRSPRPRSGRTSRSRRSGSGPRAGGQRARSSGLRWCASRSARAGRIDRLSGCRRRKRPRPASCAAERTGRRGGSPLRSVDRTRPCMPCWPAGAAQADLHPSGQRSSATNGHAQASCCTWTPSAWDASRHLGTRSPAIAVVLPQSRLGVRALDRRRLLPAGLLRDPRRRDGRHAHRVHHARSTGSWRTASSLSHRAQRLDRDLRAKRGGTLRGVPPRLRVVRALGRYPFLWGFGLGGSLMTSVCLSAPAVRLARS